MEKVSRLLGKTRFIVTKFIVINQFYHLLKKNQYFYKKLEGILNKK